MNQTKLISVDEIMEKAACSAAVFSQLGQEHTDRIVRAVYEAGFNNRVRLSKLAQKETGIGKWEDKVLKTVLGTQLTYENIKDLKTAGVLSDDPLRGIVEIAQPRGPVLAFTPVTNPASTVLFKILICMKTRNPIIISPHPKAVECSSEAARICYEAALKEDAPEDCIQCVPLSRDQRQAFMSHRKLGLIFATSVEKIVEEAYRSGTPALGVASGNVPAFIERTADVPFSVEQIIASKTFDNGTISSSEQAVVAERPVVDEVINQFKQRNAYLLSREETRQLESVAFDKEKGRMNPSIVGQPASVIADKAKINAPSDVQLLIAHLDEVGPDYPLSGQILAPILAFYTASNFDSAVNLCMDLIYYGGAGHTASIFSNDDEKINKFASVMNTGRVLVNTPSSQGAIGLEYTMLTPSLSPGGGTVSKTITTDNITVKHLLNIQRIARRRVDPRLEHFDKNKYFDESLDARSIEKEFNRDY